MSEFSYIIFKINEVSKRLSLLKANDQQSALVTQEIESLLEFRKYLIEIAVSMMIDIPFVLLANSFFEDNRELYRDKEVRDENDAIFSQLLKQAAKAVITS